jgi:hypothetical protein
MQVYFFHGLPKEDILDVHLATWDNGDLIWLKAWLMEEFPGSQVFFVKYGSALRNANFHMNNIAENLLSDLLLANIGQVPNCPVVLVGHCIGGLVIKELCLKAHEELHLAKTSRTKKLGTCLDNIGGIFLYSTPHHGIREIDRASYLRKSPLFKFFKTLSTDAAVQSSRFDKLCTKYFEWKVRGVGESLKVQSVRIPFA